jgi:hypothetical protein
MTSKLTTDHQVIRNWVESRGGKPAVAKSIPHNHRLGVLRIEFSDFGGDEVIETVEWEEWFATFDNRELAFLYQETTVDGHQSRFYKPVSRDNHFNRK